MPADFRTVDIHWSKAAGAQSDSWSQRFAKLHTSRLTFRSCFKSQKKLGKVDSKACAPKLHQINLWVRTTVLFQEYQTMWTISQYSHEIKHARLCSPRWQPSVRSMLGCHADPHEMETLTYGAARGVSIQRCQSQPVGICLLSPNNGLRVIGIWWNMRKRPSGLRFGWCILTLLSTWFLLALADLLFARGSNQLIIKGSF